MFYLNIDIFFDDQPLLIEYSQNCNRIYKLMERIQVWNEKLNQLY